MKFFIKILCCWIPKKKWRKVIRQKLENAYNSIASSLLTTEKKLYKAQKGETKIIFNYKDFENIQKSYIELLKKIKEKIKIEKKIRVAFLVHWVSSWAAEQVLLKMLNNSFFEVSIIVAPTLVYNSDKAIKVYNDNLNILKQRYGKKVTIYEAYDVKKKNIIDYLDKCDVIFVPSNDEKIEFNEYKIYNIIKHGILSCYICYAYYSAKDDAIFSDTYNLCWKVFVENYLNFKDLKERQPLKGKNAYITGYPKADRFLGLTKTPHKRKKIILAPHHSVHGYGLQSQFLKYSSLFMKLPQMYPEIDFIFRPHPLLYNTLCSSNYWGEEKTKEYYDKISAYENCIYDTTPDYYQSFFDSDGIIHDCGSFLPEYLFTDNPACYMLRDRMAIDEYFGPFGKGCLDCYYKSYEEKDIINYIDNVVINGNDDLKQERKQFVDEVIKYNFPNATDTLLKYIKDELS